MKVLVVFGTRPEAVKCFPVVLELQKREGAEVKVCVTAQHRQILDRMLEPLGLVPHHDLNLMRAKPSLADITSDVLIRIGEVLDKEKPDRVLVQGDTTTTMATALAAYYRKIPVGHVEAGLRSGNNYSPWPEEINRKIVGAIADMHFAPTEQARQNLLRENIPESQIHVTGNTVIDALFEIRARMNGHGARDPEVRRVIDAIGTGNKRLILVTSHRRENWGDGIEQICLALRELADRGDVHIAYPVHPNPNVREPVYRMLADHPGITLVEPLDYLPFVELMNRSHLILTDSGGVQEEAPALGKPVLVLRDTTERPEGIASGNAILVGVSAQKIVREANRLLDDENAWKSMSRSRNPYGDGMAAKRIAEHVVKTAHI
ncbi:MAG: UDP-N-acetylglucosamine 2-epimerase (non-hydrolyzing) [Pseudomonadota bacterium]|nr:UDP-N-acetylglucosamine 2-epimerase (non-hydrolyzing) [Pseudomonadota bacterium]